MDAGHRECHSCCALPRSAGSSSALFWDEVGFLDLLGLAFVLMLPAVQGAAQGALSGLLPALKHGCYWLVWLSVIGQAGVVETTLSCEAVCFVFPLVKV